MFPELWLFENLDIETFQQVISKPIWASGFNFGQLIGDDE